MAISWIGWPSLISESNYLSFSESPCAGRIPSSFCLRQYMGGKILFEEYQDVCLVLISEWSEFIYSESPCCMMHPIKFLLKRINGFEDVG